MSPFTKIPHDDEDEQYLQADDDSLSQNDADAQNMINDLGDPINGDANTNTEVQEDPLDAYMSSLAGQVGANQERGSETYANYKSSAIDLQQDEQQDESSFMMSQEDSHQLKQSDNQGKHSSKPSKHIASLQPLLLSQHHFEPFKRDFYQQHHDIELLSEEQAARIRTSLEIHVEGVYAPKPIVSFGHIGLPSYIERYLIKSQLEQPTPIQAQAIPAAMKGRDILGIAKTGSGKTLAYLLPMLVHVTQNIKISSQGPQRADGPHALILAPTRELCQQIYIESVKYGNKCQLRIQCLLGGENKHEQWKKLKAGVDVLIASPGRLIQMLKKKATVLTRITFVVLDEADRMLSLGFQSQIRSIVGQMRPDKQSLLFTATMKKAVQFLVGDLLVDPVKIIVGEQKGANQDIKQEAIVMSSREEKISWLKNNLVSLLNQGKILVFANQRSGCQELGRIIQKELTLPVAVLHGEKSQYERTTIMNNFKSSVTSILVATDVASRGIDVKGIHTVINFECPRNVESYIHRIGRAGRAGEEGRSVSLLVDGDVKFAGSLIRIFEDSGSPVPQELEELAYRDEIYKRKRLTSKMGVKFAKGKDGKDVSKYFNQIIQKQKAGYSRAGLGHNVAPINNNRRNQNNYPATRQDGPSLASQLDTTNLSISEVSKLVREKLAQKANSAESDGTVYNGRFVRSSQSGDNTIKKVEVVFYQSTEKGQSEKTHSKQ